MPESAIGKIPSSKIPRRPARKSCDSISRMAVGRGRGFQSNVGPAPAMKYYQAIAALGTAHFDHDSGNNPITPVNVLMAGFWNMDVSGLVVGEKTVKTGGAQGTWTTSSLVSPPAASRPSPLLRFLHGFRHERGDGVRGLQALRHLLGRVQFVHQQHRMGRSGGSGERHQDDRRRPRDELCGLRRRISTPRYMT